MTTNEKINIDDVLKEIERVYLHDSREWIIGYSGGKDSTVVVQLVFQMLLNLPAEKRHKKVHIVSSDTLIENPMIIDYLKNASELIGKSAHEQNIPLYTHMVHPRYDNSFWANIIGKGLPTPTSIRFRWCTEKLKIQPSNQFIQEKVAENGEVIVLLGVRKSESIARRNRINKREIEGYLLTPHASLTNTYVYNPIVDLVTDDVWSVLLSNNGVNPWGGDNNELFALYMGADSGECPFTITKDSEGKIETPSCGNSRFGCWICTVVNEDKSLTGFINNGEDWMSPLLDFRAWLLRIRDNHEYRQQYRRDGNHYYKKVYLKTLPIDIEGIIEKSRILQSDNGKEFISLNSKDIDISELTNKEKLYLELIPLSKNNNHQIDMSKVLEDEKGRYIKVLGYGPFNFEARKMILKELLEIQRDMDYELITMEELKAIDKIWDDEVDLTKRSLVEIYNNVFGEKLPWDEFKKPMFDITAMNTIYNACDKANISRTLISKLLIETEKNKHQSNKSKLVHSIEKTFNQKYLHKEAIEGIENDN